MVGGPFGAEYETAVDELLEDPFSEVTVDGRLTRWEEQIAGAVDEAYEADADQVSLLAWQAGIIDLREPIEILRNASVERAGG